MIKNIVDKIADRIRWGYLTAFILLLISYIISFISTQNLTKQANLVTHSNNIIHELENLVHYVTQSESAARGYVISNDKQFLNKFYISRHNADSVWKGIKYLTSDNDQQQKNLDTLKQIINDKLDFTQENLLQFDSDHSIKTIIYKQSDGVKQMNRVENYTRHVQVVEMQLERQRTAKATKYTDIIKIFTIVSLIVAILLTLFSIFTFNKENKAKQDASEKANSYRKQLELRIDELAAVNLELVELKNIEKFAATGRISRTIAHEVRNPLTNIKLAAEQLKNELPGGNEDFDIYFGMIQRNANRINQLISDLLNSTRINELSYITTSINDVIEASLEFAKDRIELKHIKVIKKFDNDICNVFVDKEKIIIALLNIIVNSVEAMDDRGTLHIFTENKNNKCIVTITDNGRGMSRDEQASLFEPFFTTKEKGTGLGLTNTQNIILAHSGSIKVESELGKGSSFSISFNFA